MRVKSSDKGNGMPRAESDPRWRTSLKGVVLIMGKSAVDLPDPLSQKQREQSAPSAPADASDATSADDLLAKLADSEIDRLLAEAEVQRTPDEPAEAVDAPVDPIKFDPPRAGIEQAETPEAESEQEEATPTAPVAEAKPTEAAGEEQPATEQPEPSAAAAETEPVASTESATSAESSVSNQLDQLFCELKDGARPPEPETSAPAVPAEVTGAAPAAPAVPAADSAPATDDSTATTVAERNALQAISAEVEAGEREEQEAAEARRKRDRVPLMLRPLVWINAPFAACSQGVRETLGKVAIITLVNALAVLLYVLIFR
jgi:hypothetical protein